MMTYHNKLKEEWNVLKGKLKQQFAQLTDDDLLWEEGKEQELFARLERRLGRTRQQVNEIIDRLATTRRQPDV
jgi:uncharacterized protein YjbJ (UPF0337 family)